MRYDKKIHSPIFGPDEKPVHVGWYASSSTKLGLSSDDIEENITGIYWWYWDGIMWFADGCAILAGVQDRYWFGLREKP